MTSTSNSLSARDDELDGLVFSYLEMRDEGVSHEAAIDSVLTGVPDRKEDLRRSLDTLREAGLIAPQGGEKENFPTELGGYRLVRRLGSGGMGVVFLAESREGVPVALKLIRPEQLYFDRARARFQRELDSAARLEHEGIARVLESGEERGIPYLAQNWIPGASLDEVLSALPSRGAEELSGRSLMQALRDQLPPEAPAEFDESAFEGPWVVILLRIVLQVARALEHAHGRGVLHRDVKPSNIMLTPGGRAVVVDFGLARVADGLSMTRTGAQPGSLPYMSPEQVDGSPRDLDERTDVYSLGVTLYELLTLRQPYKSRSSERLRAQIMESNPLPVRKLNAQITRAAEVLCLKAMEREPRRRYRHASEFAEDIERLLNGRPILARPPAPWLRLARWVERQPLRATSLALALAAPMSWAAMSQSSLSEVRAAYQKEQEAKAMVDRHLGMTLQAIRRLFADLSDEEIDNTPHLQRTRLVAIDLALEVLEKLCAERPDDWQVLAERANLVRRRADYLGGLGRHSEAIKAYADHAQVYRRLVEKGPPQERTRYKRELSLSVERCAALMLADPSRTDGLAAYEEALDLLREVSEETPIDSGSHAQLAVALEIYTHQLRLRNRHEEALASVDEAILISDRVLERFPRNPQALQCAANLISARSLVLKASGLQQDELAEHLRSVALLRRALALDPKSRLYLHNFAEEASGVAHLLSDRREHEVALELSAEAADAARYLVESFPSISGYKRDLLKVLSVRAIVLGRSGEEQAGYELMKEQAQVALELYDQDPARNDAPEMAVTLLNNLAVSELFFTHDTARVLKAVHRAQSILVPALELDPERLYWKELELSLCYTEALALLLNDQPDAGLEIAEQFEALAESADVRWQSNVADLWAEWIASAGRALPMEPELAEEGRDRAFGALHRALEQNHPSMLQVLDSNIFDQVLSSDPRWPELLRRAGVESVK